MERRLADSQQAAYRQVADGQLYTNTDSHREAWRQMTGQRQGDSHQAACRQVADEQLQADSQKVNKGHIKTGIRHKNRRLRSLSE